MIKHIVMFQLKDKAQGKTKEENLAIAQERLSIFGEVIPSLVRMEVQVNAKEAADSNYDLVLICDFNSMADLDAYQKHPKHLEFAEFITAVRENRACIDYTYEV